MNSLDENETMELMEYMEEGIRIVSFSQLSNCLLELGGREEAIVANRIAPAVVGAIASAGASAAGTLFGQGDGSHSTYQMPNGARFNANDCWQVLHFLSSF